MFEKANFNLMIATKDMARARKFWEGTLGFKAADEGPDGGVRLTAPSGEQCYLYPSQFAGTAQNTVAGFEVDDFDATIEELRGKGVKFEEYDLPEIKTVNGVVDWDGWKGAWFKDPDGNIIAVTSRVPALV